MRVAAIIVIIAALVGAFLYGRRIRQDSAAAASNKAQLDTNWTDVVGAASFREKAEQRTIEAVKIRAPLAMKRRDLRAQATVSLSAVDSSLIPPAVIALVGLDDALIRADSVTIGALTLENIAIKIERDAWRTRAQLLEQRVRILERQRCGKKCVAGGVVLLGLVLKALDAVF